MVFNHSSEREKLIEVGRLLQQSRELAGFTMEDMGKKLGMRSEQIQAIEEGNTQYFKKTAQPLIWFARIYAKKLKVDLPELVFMDIKRASGTPSQPIHKIPAFLMKQKTDSND